MLSSLRPIYAFNQHQRDLWVAKQAALVAAGSDVLDVGAGSCPYRSFFAHCTYKAHDFVQLPMNELYGKKGYGDIDYVSDVLSLPVPDASIDVILCTEVLEHVPDPIRAIAEFARVLRPEGRLILTAPLGSGLHQEPYHFYGGYTPHWYRRYLSKSGFSAVTIEPNGGFFRHYGQESIRFAFMLRPWQSLRHFIFLPLWVLSIPWLLLVAPLAGPILDWLDQKRAFTVGYHVTATRSS